MITYPCRACAKKVILPLLPTTPQGITQICQPQSCTAQLTSGAGSLERCFAETFSAKPSQKKSCKLEAGTSSNSDAKAFRMDLNLSRIQRGRQCVACDVLHASGGRSASHSGSRSNSNSRRPSFLSHRARRNAADKPNQVCKQQSIPCGDSAYPARLCTCLTTCRQREQGEPLYNRLSTSLGYEEPSAIHKRCSCCGLSRIPRYHRCRHCCCRVERALQENAQDPEAKPDNSSSGDSWEKLSCEAPPKETSRNCKQLCSLNIGNRDKDETLAEDGETTLQWALRNVRAEAARTQRVLEGCRSQLLARDEKLKFSAKSPRASKKQVSAPCTPRTCLDKRRDDGGDAPAAPHAMAARRDATVATPAIESQQRQRQQLQKQQELMSLLFQRKFEKEMQAFRRRLTDVTGSLSDKLGQLLERETQLKQTMEELLKERENSSRLRRIYFEATKKNAQLATRNTSLERALLDIKLKLCQPHKVWKLLGCPAAAAIQNELQRNTRLCEDSATAAEGTAAYTSAPTRKRICSAYPPDELGTTVGHMPSREEKCPNHRATSSLEASFQHPADMYILSRANHKSCWSETRHFRSLPCYLHPSENSCESSPEERGYEGDAPDGLTRKQGQQRMGDKTEEEISRALRRTTSNKRDGNRKNMQQATEAASPRRIQQRTPKGRVFDGNKLVSSSAAAAKTQRRGSRTETGKTLQTPVKKEAEKSLCLTQRLCKFLQRSKTGVGP